MNANWVRVLVVVLVVTNVLWAYLFIDRSVTIQHQSDALTRETARARLLASLVGEIPKGATKNEVVEAIRLRFPEVPVKHAGDTVEVGEVIVEFKNGALTRVVPM